MAEIWVYQMASACFQEDAQCGSQGVRDTVILKGILEEFTHYSSLPELSYDSEKQHPGTFLIDGNVRIAKTGSTWRSPIVINEDLIVLRDGTGESRPISLLEAASVLLHEFGHHQSEELNLEGIAPKCEELDRLASKARSLLEVKSRKILIPKQVNPKIRDPYPTLIQLVDIDYQDGSGSRSTLFTIETSQGTYDVTQIVAGLSKCPSVYVDGVLDFAGRPFQIFLKRISDTKILPVDDGVKVALTVPEAGMMCMNPSGSNYMFFPGYRDGLLQMYFKLNADGVLEFKRDLSSLKITVPPDWQMHSQ